MFLNRTATETWCILDVGVDFSTNADVHSMSTLYFTATNVLFGKQPHQCTHFNMRYVHCLNLNSPIRDNLKYAIVTYMISSTVEAGYIDGSDIQCIHHGCY